MKRIPPLPNADGSDLEYTWRIDHRFNGVFRHPPDVVNRYGEGWARASRNQGRVPETAKDDIGVDPRTSRVEADQRTASVVHWAS